MFSRAKRERSNPQYFWP